MLCLHWALTGKCNSCARWRGAGICFIACVSLCLFSGQHLVEDGSLRPNLPGVGHSRVRVRAAQPRDGAAEAMMPARAGPVN